MKNLIIVVVILAALGYVGSKLLLHSKVEKGVDQAVVMISPFVNVKYDGVSSTMGGELTMDTVEAQINDFDDPITIDRLGIDTPSYFSLLDLADMANNAGNPDDIIPEYFGFIAEGIRMPVNADYFRSASIHFCSNSKCKSCKLWKYRQWGGNHNSRCDEWYSSL